MSCPYCTEFELELSALNNFLRLARKDLPSCCDGGDCVCRQGLRMFHTGDAKVPVWHHATTGTYAFVESCCCVPIEMSGFEIPGNDRPVG
jgi:hypothetical protein